MRRISLAFATVLVLLLIEVGRAPSGHAQAPAKGGTPAFQVMETTVDAVQAAYKAGTLTARQLVQIYLNRIEKLDKAGPTINSIITLNAHALEDADRLDAAFKTSGLVGPLHGIPILVKDEIDTAGMPTTLGTLIFKDFRPPRDSFVVEQLRKAGAIILGKTTLSEFAGGDTYGSMFGVTRNPYALERTVGGSSGGSGAALAANFSTLALGEETSASIRRPGGWNGLVALRPTPGLVSRSGMWDGYPRPNAQMGPMSRTVRDLAKLLDAMVRYDPEDPLTAMGVGQSPKTYTASLVADGLKGARIGILRDIVGSGTDPSSEDFKMGEAEFQKNVAELEAAGAIVIDPIVIPDLKRLQAARSSDNESSDEALHVYLSRNPDSPLKTREDIANAPDMAKSIPPNKANQWKNPRRPTNYQQEVEYLKARDQLAINTMKVMADHQLDAIVFKTVEQGPPLIKDGVNPPYVAGTGYISTLNTFLIHASVVTVPSGFRPDGIPVGITFFGRPFSESTLIKLAYSYEQSTHHRKAPPSTPALANLSN